MSDSRHSSMHGGSSVPAQSIFTILFLAVQAQCGAGNCDKAGVAMAMLPLPRGALRVLGTLAPLAEPTVANAVSETNRHGKWK